MATGNAIGLDIGSSGVRAAELSISRNGVVLQRFGQVALPEGAVREGEVVDQPTVTSAIRDLWSMTKFSGQKVIMGVASQRVIVRQIEVPKMPPNDLRKALPFQVQEYLPMPVHDAVIDFHPVEELPGTPPTLRGLMVAASREVVNGNVAAAEAAGLKPMMVDLTSFAVLRSVGAQDSTLAGEALIDIGSTVTNLVVHHAGVPQFVRILLMGGTHITDQVSERLGIPAQDAESLKQRVGVSPSSPKDTVASKVIEGGLNQLIDEIRGSIEYYNAAKPAARVERVLVTGGTSLMPGVYEKLSAALRLPVEPGDPISRIQLGDTGLAEEQVALATQLAAVPIGLALGAA